MQTDLQTNHATQPGAERSGIAMLRRFPPPWTVEAIPKRLKLVDAKKQAIAYVYGYANPRDAGVANALTLDARR